MNPFVNFTEMNDNELASKIHDLTNKYFMTHNADLKYQISTVLEMYKQELNERRIKTYNEQFIKQKNLDNLIKVN
jgi:hypothetical protein